MSSSRDCRLSSPKGTKIENQTIVQVYILIELLSIELLGRFKHERTAL